MVIMHNLSAMNAGRMYGMSSKRNASISEKLASGYKINRAADDAAGLSISEKMRRQIRGLNQGVENIEDGISFLKIADGAANEINDMLGRLTELSVQAANGTLTDSDRKSIDEEVQQIKREIDRINDTTKFNERRVFFEEGAISQTMTPTTNSGFFQLMGENASSTGYMEEEIPADKLKDLNYTAAHNIEGGNPFTGVHINFEPLMNSGYFKELNGKEFYVNCCTDCCPIVVQFDDSTSVTISDQTPSPNVQKVITIGLKDVDTGNYFKDANKFNEYIVNSLKNSAIGGHVQFANDKTTNNLLIYDIDPNPWSDQNKKWAYFCDTSNIYNPGTMLQEGMRIQMSGEVGDFVVISTGVVDTKALGIAAIKVDPIEEAEKSLEKVKNAIATTLEIRTRIGAQQNRLEHAANINRNTAENTTAAEAVIRDTDMAKAMVEYSNIQIMMQAGEAMLAQANQSKNSVLQLINQ